MCTRDKLVWKFEFVGYGLTKGKASYVFHLCTNYLSYYIHLFYSLLVTLRVYASTFVVYFWMYVIMLLLSIMLSTHMFDCFCIYLWCLCGVMVYYYECIFIYDNLYWSVYDDIHLFIVSCDQKLCFDDYVHWFMMLLLCNPYWWDIVQYFWMSFNNVIVMLLLLWE